MRVATLAISAMPRWTTPPTRSASPSAVCASMRRCRQKCCVRSLRWQLIPVYAGAYVFGRTGSRARFEEGRKVITHGVTRRREEWEVLIRDHHDGYISWE